MSGFFDFYDSRSLSNSDDQGCLPALSMKERVTGFCICFGLSVVIDFLSFGSMLGLLTGSPTRFALSYSLGNILSIAGIGFLIGFQKQWKSICDKKRWIASTVYLSSILLTLLSALVFEIPILVLMFIIVQLCAFIWYVASYFPWGREILRSCFKTCCQRCMDV